MLRCVLDVVTCTTSASQQQARAFMPVFVASCDSNNVAQFVHPMHTMRKVKSVMEFYYFALKFSPIVLLVNLQALVELAHVPLE